MLLNEDVGLLEIDIEARWQGEIDLAQATDELQQLYFGQIGAYDEIAGQVIAHGEHEILTQLDCAIKGTLGTASGLFGEADFHVADGHGRRTQIQCPARVVRHSGGEGVLLTGHNYKLHYLDNQVWWRW